LTVTVWLSGASLLPSSIKGSSFASPAVWQYLRQNWIANTVFKNYDAIVDAACDAWRNLIAL
jgi:hypothetical protein